MAGTAKNYSATDTLWNPADVWIDVAVPAAGASITLNTDGTPDATANPNARHLGMTEKGTKCTYSYAKAEARSDELTAAHRTKIVTEDMTIEGSWKQLLDPDLLEILTVGGTKATRTGGTAVTFGGKASITGRSIVVIAEQQGNPGAFVAFHVYQGYNESATELSNTRESETSSPFKFMAQSVTTRVVGDQMGQIYIET